MKKNTPTDNERQMIMVEKTIRWGILGYARIASMQVIPAIVEATNATPYAIASRSAEKCKQALQSFPFVKAYDSYEALLQDPDVDAVYIPLPNSLHKEWTLKAARAGKHVLCEKPLALTEADCREMIDVCKASGVKLMEAFMYRYTTRIRKLCELIESGAIGEIRHIHSTYCFLLNRDSIKLKPELGGGSLWDVGCYPINIIGMLLKAAPVSYSAQKVMQGGVDISFCAALKYPGDVLCTMNCGFDSAFNNLTEINGTKGTILMRDTFMETETPFLLVQGDTVTQIPVEPCKRYVLEIESFSDAIVNDREPFLSLEETVRNNSLMAELLKVAAE